MQKCELEFKTRNNAQEWSIPVPNDHTNMLNVVDAMKTCKNMKKMIKAQVLETLKWKCKRERLEKRGHHEFLY